MSRDAAMDVSNAPTQAAIADSLLGEDVPGQQEEQEQSEYAAHGDELLSQFSDERAEEKYRLENGDAAWREKYGEPEEAQTEQPQQREAAPEREQFREQEQPQEQPHAPTPQEVQAGVEKLDATVNEYELNVPADSLKDAQEFCAAFGADIYQAGVDVGALGSVRGKAAVSALQLYEATGGDLSQMPDIPMQNAIAFSHDAIKGMGLDPRSVPHDPMLLSRTYLGGYMNLIKTCDAYGWDKNRLAQINDGDTAEFYFRNFQKAFRVEEKPKEQMTEEERQTFRTKAIKFADANANHLFRVREKILQVNGQRAASQPKQGRSRGQRVPERFREGVKGSRVPNFSSNQDIFSGPAVEAAMSQKL